MAKKFCIFSGAALILVGLIGIPFPHLLGMHLSKVHNLIHIASGITAIGFGIFGTQYAARAFCMVFGIVYFSLGVLGFIAPDLVTRVLHVSVMDTVVSHSPLTADNIVHLVLGLTFVVVAFLPMSMMIFPERNLEPNR